MGRKPVGVGYRVQEGQPMKLDDYNALVRRKADRLMKDQAE